MLCLHERLWCSGWTERQRVLSAVVFRVNVEAARPFGCGVQGERRGSTSFRKVSKFIPDDTVSQRLLTYSLQQSPSWEANRFSASQVFSHYLWNPKVNYRTHKRPPNVPILSQLDPVHTSRPTSWRSILILSSDLRLVTAFRTSNLKRDSSFT